jgi:hypothetical protein
MDHSDDIQYSRRATNPKLPADLSGSNSHHSNQSDEINESHNSEIEEGVDDESINEEEDENNVLLDSSHK